MRHCRALHSTPSVLNVRYNGAKKQDPDVHRGRRTGLCSVAVACRHYLVSTSVFAASPKLPFTLLLSCGQSQPLYEPGKTEHELSDASSPAPPLEHSSLRHAVFLPNLWLSSLWNGCAAPGGMLPFSLRVCFQGEENRAWRVNVWQLLPSAAKAGPDTHPQKYSS